jgi:osmotically-inducible protein OsmY
MRKSLYLLVFVLALTLAYASSQTSGSGSTTNQTSGQTQTSSPANAPDQTPASPSQTEPAPRAAVSDGDLQAQIQNALKNEPTLSNESVRVAVSDDQIDLSGAVATAKEKLTAKRIVQSYAGNRKVKDHLTLGGHSPDNGANPVHNNTENPATNPDQNRHNPPSGPPPPK